MANQTRVGAPDVSGGLFSGDLDAVLPTDPTKPFDASLGLTGLVGEDGLSETPERSSDDKRDWSGDVARSVQTEYGLKITLTFIERTTRVLKEVHGQDNVEETEVDGGTLRTIKHNSRVLPRRVFAAKLKDGDVSILKVYPNAQVTEVGETQYTSSELISYEVTITCYKDESGNNGYEYEYTPGKGLQSRTVQVDDSGSGTVTKG